MLTLEQLRKSYPEEVFKRSPRAALVEYLQHEILDSIFKLPGSENLSFIGGTAIRIVYGSKRFSEDLDFDNFGLSFKDFQLLLGKVVVDMRDKGFDVEFRMVEKNAYHCYIKFPSILFDNQMTGHKEEKILVRVDATPKRKLVKPEVFVLNKFDIYRNILVNSDAVILAQKLIAIIQRKREKGRDFYDVSYLFGFTQPDYEFLKKVYGYSKERLKDEILNRVKRLDMRKLANDVSPFLLNLEDKKRVLEFEKFIRQVL